MHTIDVSIVYALKDRLWLKELAVPRGTTVADLIELSSLLSEIEDLPDMELLEFGVYSEKVVLDYLLQQNDRVEIYRPLKADPKEVRRQLALLGKTMGKTTS